MDSSTTGLRIDPSMMARLRALATRRGCSAKHLLAEALLPFLAREEAFERERDEDDARYQHYLDTGEAFDHREVAAWLDSLDTENPLPAPRGPG